MSKIKVSHTIDEELVEWMDSQIAKKRFASRSHAIEFALQQLIEAENPIGGQKHIIAQTGFQQSQDLGYGIAEKERKMTSRKK